MDGKEYIITIYGCMNIYLENFQCNTALIALEVGSLGHCWLSSTNDVLIKILIDKSNLSTLLDEAGEITITASNKTFLTRH